MSDATATTALREDGRRSRARGSKWTPTCNTGGLNLSLPVNPPSILGARFHLDYLEGSMVKGLTAFQAMRKIELASGQTISADSWELMPGQAHHRWRQVFHGTHGLQLWAGNTEGHGVHLVAKGEACSWMGTQRCLELAALLVRFTRLDPCIDDMLRRVSPDDLYDRLLAGDPGIIRKTDKFSRYNKQSRAGSEGSTVYIGGPSSERRLMIYDKTAESDGAIDAYRWEARYRKTYAQALGERLVNARHDLVDVGCIIRGAFTAMIDFRVPSSKHRDNVERWDRESWWSDLIDNATRTPMAPASLATPRARLLRGIKWADNSLSSMIGFVIAAGLDVVATVNDAVANAPRRITELGGLVPSTVAPLPDEPPAGFVFAPVSVSSPVPGAQLYVSLR